MPHIHELYDYSVDLIIVNNNRVLFIKHPRYGKWLTPGGHIELDEDPEQALYREAQEETGLPLKLVSQVKGLGFETTTKSLPVPNFMDVHEANPPHKHIGLKYILVAEHDRVRLSNEHQDFAWLSQSDLSDPLYQLSPSLQHYATEALKLVKQQ